MTRMDADIPYFCFHTAGATGSIPVPPTNKNKGLARLPENLLLEFGTVGPLESRQRHVAIGPYRLARDTLSAALQLERPLRDLWAISPQIWG